MIISTASVQMRRENAERHFTAEDAECAEKSSHIVILENTVGLANGFLPDSARVHYVVARSKRTKQSKS